MVNGSLLDFCCSFKWSNKKKHFICTLKLRVLSEIGSLSFIEMTSRTPSGDIMVSEIEEASGIITNRKEDHEFSL